MSSEIDIELYLFARMREACGNRSHASVRVPDGATPQICFDRLCEDFPELRAQRRGLVVAVNEEYAAWDRPLVAGDSVSFIPPVSGG